MQTQAQSPWWPRLAAFVLAGLAAGSAVFWGLKWPGQVKPNLGATLAMAEAAPVDPAALAVAFGGGPVAEAVAPMAVVSPVASRLTLIGVAANPARGGAALISVDGKPAKPYGVGAVVEEGLVLQSVGPRTAMLGANLKDAASVTLALPEIKP